ncbi:nucleoside triphosphate pyrophosphohydrolase family protein [Caulobacter sp.]|uniref:nucleoside triphosphate pyrophosphohydrolase family protein n=1 Tax=Caulobacter sp. TaxID=78 RepID=UPI0025C4E95F|nr:nucleoside triphosphate pyrophosphohydrolase family protein [Caulobacter sp.]MBQ1561660.1 nucleoside triphosphate pyrophosphohydrolase family protein [Caulobacter sp.]
MSGEFETLTVGDYAKQAARTDQRSGKGALGFSMLGLFGEAGSLLSEAKKKQRDAASYLGYADAVAEELGDVLWYLAAVARRSALTLSDIAANAARNDDEWQAGGNDALSFHALQPAHIPLAKAPMPQFEHTLLALAGEVGVLVNGFQSGALKRDKAMLARKLVAVMRRLIQAANDSGVTIEAAAVKNLHKIFDRWPREKEYPAPFDATMDPEEQLPRRMTIDVYERKVRGQTFVYQRSSGVYVGDRLTDNAVEPDDYRFHDVFHYAHVAVLGWSPVIRALLRLKRKSDPKLDDAEDGARAILIEEGVTSWIFGQAQQLRYFDKVKSGGLPLDMLKHVRQFVAGYESERCPLWLWEEAILQGYAAFRFLQKHRSGRVTIDFAHRRLRIKELPS